MRRAERRRSFLVNGYPDGELGSHSLRVWDRRRAAFDRLRRMDDAKRQRAQQEADMAKLKDMEPVALLDCSYAAQDLFNALPRIPATDQATLIDYVEMRLDMWRKANGSPDAMGGED